ncbi:hypothetical protein HU200_016903 [Digitaria exilis]|uniref:Uncharacterized protein n=1 Tax=Digitaria exilis TaxID=1010633 RepID=A0A835F8J7_9POAL|nr:hypothetical protein HU200_016903 [Digitaria exilis]
MLACLVFPFCSRTYTYVLSEKLGSDIPWTRVPALEKKVAEWSQGRPLIWNAGIGSAASFLPTLTRLLSERIEDLHGPHDLITRVSLTPSAVATKDLGRLEFEILMELARFHHIPLPDHIQRLSEDEGYFGYGIISDDMSLKAIGHHYFMRFSFPLRHEANFDHTLYEYESPLQQRINRALQGKKHLLVVENLYAPISIEYMVSLLGRRWPSQFNNRWIISTTSRDHVHKSKMGKFLSTNTALPFDDLGEGDWAALIKEALHDAAVSIHDTLQQQQQGRDQEFWLHVAHHCLYYGILYHPLQGAAACQATTNNTSSVTSDELVRCWVAEGLLSSSTRPTHKPAAITRTQSNYYRSAYEAGKVVIEALQKYSLLPVYSVCVSTPTSSTSWMSTNSASNSHDEITGVSKLAEGVPQLKRDELAHRHTRGTHKWVSFMNDDGRHVSWNWHMDIVRSTRSPLPIIKMSTLILRGYSNISDFPFDKVLNRHLRVLDLSYTTINSLPQVFSQLLNLRLLSLRGCSQLETLSPPPSTSEQQTPLPLALLENLQVLDMNGVPLLEITQQDSRNKRNLHYLDLSGSRFSTLPSDFFCEMPCLEELVLGNCSRLKELPPSLVKLCNLLILHVEGTQITILPEDMFNAMKSLHTLKLVNNMLLMSLPMSISEAKGLKELHLCNCISLRSLPRSLSKAKGFNELHISNCTSLKLRSLLDLLTFVEDLYIGTWEALEDIKIHGHPNLRTFSLSEPLVKCVSLRGCSRLKSVIFSDDLIALEQVDLSGTALEEVPHNLPNLPQLRILKKIFYQNGKYDVALSPLPSIKSIYLQELPQLQCIHDDVTFRFEAPKWKKLFVRGCQSFHHLPLLKKEYQKSKVEVSGEREWWGKLKWSLPEQSDYYLHVPPPEFVSRKKHIIRSYLR